MVSGICHSTGCRVSGFRSRAARAWANSAWWEGVVVRAAVAFEDVLGGWKGAGRLVASVLARKMWWVWFRRPGSMRRAGVVSVRTRWRESSKLTKPFRATFRSSLRYGVRVARSGSFPKWARSSSSIFHGIR